MAVLQEWLCMGAYAEIKNIHLHSIWYVNGAGNTFERRARFNKKPKIYYNVDVKSQN